MALTRLVFSQDLSLGHSRGVDDLPCWLFKTVVRPGEHKVTGISWMYAALGE